jgi:AcrR family transcriptional regulator
MKRAATGDTSERAKAKAESRAALLRAGIELMGLAGLDGPSLDAICAHAGYTRGAFYVHFADRDEFLVAVMDEVGERFLDQVLAPEGAARAGGEDDDLMAPVKRFLQAVAKGDYPLMGEGGVRPHQLLDACARSPRIRERYVALVEDAIRRTAKSVRASQKAGALREDVAATDFARLLLAGIIGAQTMAELGVPVDLGRLARALFTLVRAG